MAESPELFLVNSIDFKSRIDFFDILPKLFQRIKMKFLIHF